ncbi:MAG: adenylate/guanylate cyclase domain-containing protein [Candidatus Limnocylindria bacterium]
MSDQVGIIGAGGVPHPGAKEGAVTTYELSEAAERAGISTDGLRGMVELGIIIPNAEGRYRSGDVRRAELVANLSTAGIALEDLAAAIRAGTVSLDFLDAPAFDRFSPLSRVTFGEMAERTGVSVEHLMLIREAGGSVAPTPDSRMREGELPYAAWVEAAVGAGFRSAVWQQMVRVQADGLRRVAETEAAMWQSEVIEAGNREGKRTDEILGVDFGDRMSALTERATIAMYHMQQTKAWTRNLVDGVEAMLVEAGLYNRLDRPPAMCFLDIAGYTKLTQERGDAAAAQLAEELGRLVQRTSVKHGGRAVKWLGDGVMFHFPDPGSGVTAALEMVVGVADAGLPPAHVGLHAGPVIFQEGDYYGQTVNVAARIAAYARPGEVIVSQEVVDASVGTPVAFREIGPVELHGVAGSIHLHAATSPA